MPDAPNGDILKLWMQIGTLHRQLWDASRSLDHVKRLLPRDPVVRRASKDVNAALHGAYLAQRGLKDAYPTLPSIFGPKDDAPPN